MTHPEPIDVGPAVGGDLRASDADRNQVMELLSAAYAEGRLTHDEHAERIELAATARTFDDLIPLTRDLVPVGAPLPAQAPAPVPGTVVGGASGPLSLVGVLGGSSRKGHWRVPHEIHAYSLMGGVELDFTEAEFEAGEVIITSYACMGGLDIKVPEGMDVRDETVNLMGGTDVKHTVAGSGPVLVLRGWNVMGGIDVKGPAKQLARQSRRDARRERREQRRLGR